MHVYKATLEDAEGLSALFDLYRQFYDQDANLEGAKLFLSERLQKQESVIFVAVQDLVYLGFIQLYPSFSSVSMRRTWILNDLYVQEEARGQGVAQKLLDAAKIHALQSGAKSLELQTAPDNLAAQRLYEKNGYKHDTSFRNYSLCLL
ncbi:GNAT family N-acetyltransferase [Ectobacillus sp. JY-23]|uniref:GNAT family N-acetyltransferase n=1 Tax=Ectobacillus sp. JY-23 TaxID=2933872 RepID=UPI001FF15E01|nr:GNAT family N-acetyltransferase [Ectobacillus sp. JY-23]UOY94214.1 GNAT family N-acetyltransferase [Ectobacillus sp. JY-23]